MTSCEPNAATASTHNKQAIGGDRGGGRGGAKTDFVVVGGGRRGGDDPVQGKCVCKPGPPLAASTTLKNVLVIGDSVSLGYTPVVAALLEDVALVQHAPWGGDGGAEETA